MYTILFAYKSDRPFRVYKRSGCKQAGEKPEKIKADHGRVEYKVQSRLIAAEILGQHLTMCTSYRANLRQSDLNNRVRELALYRWVFVRMNERFHKCERNKVSPILN